MLNMQEFGQAISNTMTAMHPMEGSHRRSGWVQVLHVCHQLIPYRILALQHRCLTCTEPSLSY